MALFLDRSDLALVVLDFLGGGSALRGIGTTSSALRAAVKAVMPTLHVMPPLYVFERGSEHIARLL